MLLSLFISKCLSAFPSLHDNKLVTHHRHHCRLRSLARCRQTSSRTAPSMEHTTCAAPRLHASSRSLKFGSTASQNACSPPYTKAGGITDTHGAFIRQSTVVIFIITGLSDRISQLDLAEMVLGRCEIQRLIMVACCDFTFQNLQWYDFETVIRISGFSKACLGAAGSALLDRPDSPIVGSVEPWSQIDIAEMNDVWT